MSDIMQSFTELIILEDVISRTQSLRLGNFIIFLLNLKTGKQKKNLANKECTEVINY